MTGANEEGGDWLNQLNAVDRATATRWLREGGGIAAFSRIAHAFVSARRRKGRPEVDYRRLVMKAAILWMTDLSVADFGDAAGRVAQGAKAGHGIKAAEKLRLPATEAALRRAIREKLEGAEREKLEPANAAFWEEAEKRASAMGKWVQRSPTDARNFLHSPGVAASVSHNRRMAAEMGLALRLAPSRATQNLASFLRALPDMPLSQVNRFLSDAANAWAAEQPDRGDPE